MLYLLLGEDEYSIRQTLEEIKRGIGDPTVLSANTTVLSGQQVTVEQLRGACETFPFMTEKRLVVVGGLLERFEPKAKSGRKKTSKADAKKDDYQAIISGLSQIPDFTIVVLVDGKIRSQNPLLRGLSAVAKVSNYPLFKNDKLRQWIGQRVRDNGGSISPPAVELLVRFVGSNLWLMSHEVDKLLMFALGRRIEEADVRSVVSYAQEANVFAMVDAILDSRASVAQGLLQQLLKQGAVPVYLLVMLSRQTRMMVRVKELKRQRKSGREIQDRLGLASEYALQRLSERANRYSLERLKEVYHRILDADLAIKTGRYDGELALNILIAELCRPQAVSGLTN